MKIYFACPTCDYPGRWDDSPPSRGGLAWQCPQCDHVVALTPPPHGGGSPGSCCVCGNPELYKKKDFPHGLGLTILALACIASTITYGLYAKWWTWTILIGSALFDGLLYLWVKDVIVCYRCQAHHRGIPGGSAVPPFELTIHERYRQERIRREQLQAQQRSASVSP